MERRVDDPRIQDSDTLSFVDGYLSRHAMAAPDTEAYVADHFRWSYAQAEKDVARFAAALVAAGIGKGDRIAFLSTPRPECFLAFLAASRIGAISVPLNAKFREDELAYLLGDSEPSILFGFAHDAEGEHADLLRRLAENNPAIRRAVIFGEGGKNETSCADWLASGAVSPIEADDIDRHPDEPALIIYTSGTTGRPKGAVLSHGALTRSALVNMQHWHVDPVIFLINLPVNHIAFMGDACCGVTVTGGTGIFQERFAPADVLGAIERERITFWGQIPTMFQLALDHQDFPDADLSSVQHILWGGAAAPRDLVKRLARLAPRLSTCFGMTETTGGVTFTRADDDLEVLTSSVGRVDPRFEIDIRSPEGQSLPPDTDGELVVRSPNLMTGYWRRPEATAETFAEGGWLKTGDIARLSPEGRVYLRGRIKEMYKSGGENVFPPEVEQVLERHPDVSAAVVIGVPDPVFGEVGMAFVMTEADRVPTEEELAAHCRAHLVNFKVPKRIQLRPLLPFLPNGKLDKQSLRQEAAEAASTHAADPSDQDSQREETHVAR